MTTPVVRTRFPPSPTGTLHVGNARTALFSWLYARHHGGQFILRFEDTDRERSTEASVQVIFDAMTWMGLDYDEGPFYQTKRFDRYAEVIQQLLDQGHAYRCYCSRERLAAEREAQVQRKEKPRYSGRCRELNRQDNAPHVIRFANPKTGLVTFNDEIRGEIAIDNRELDDLIIARTDGTPTYNLTVVVDDMDMAITHVIRGADHINNTPRQINILKALNAELPTYAHVPMILGHDGKPLSKRHGAVSVLQFRDEGYLPEAFNNYLARLGWSHGDQEIFSQEAIISAFSLQGISRSPAVFDQEKLNWLNHHYLRELTTDQREQGFINFAKSKGYDIPKSVKTQQVIDLMAERGKTFSEMLNDSAYFYSAPKQYDEKAASKHLTDASAPMLSALLAGFAEIEEWSVEHIHQLIHAVVKQFDVKFPKVALPLRVALTGNTQSPAIDQTVFLIGQEEVQSRIKSALTTISDG